VWPRCNRGSSPCVGPSRGAVPLSPGVLFGPPPPPTTRGACSHVGGTPPTGVPPTPWFLGPPPCWWNPPRLFHQAPPRGGFFPWGAPPTPKNNKCVHRVPRVPHPRGPSEFTRPQGLGPPVRPLAPTGNCFIGTTRFIRDPGHIHVGFQHASKRSLQTEGIPKSMQNFTRI